MSEAAGFVLRKGEVADLPLLYNMLYEAAAANPEIRKMDMEAALSLPMIRRYVEGWGREGDLAVVAAEPAGKQLGAAWLRLFQAENPSYGFIDESIPELTMGVIADARGRGIGTALISKIIEIARDEGYEELSLSVEKNNDAVELYTRNGFIEVGPSEHRPSSITMKRTL